MPALEGTKLQAVDLTTLAEVKQIIDASETDTSLDSLISSLIAEVSDRCTQYLGFHTLSAERTETYEGRRFERVLTLDTRPVTAVSSLKYHADTDFTNVQPTATDEYVVHSRGGWIRLLFGPVFKNNYFRVTYTGGLGADAAAVVSGFPEISHAAAMQAKYLFQRRDSLGGDVRTMAGSTEFRSEYGLQSEVRAILDQYARRG
jgi:hypothetical protein